MANTFEQSMAALAENRISAEHANLMPFRQGFVLLDFDEQEAKAFGIYRFVIGGISCMMPVVVRGGDVDGLDILIVRDLKLFVPAVDGWISMLSSLGPRAIGELLPQKDKQARGPSQVAIHIDDFPFMIKTAQTELDPKEFEALTCGLAEPDYGKVQDALRTKPVARFLPTSPTSSYLVAKAASDADFHDRFVTLYGDKVLRQARLTASGYVADSLLKKAEAERGPRVEIIEDIGDPRAQALKPAQKRILLRTGQFLLDHRAESETSTVYASPEALSLQTSPSPGRWDVLSSDGRLVPCEVAYLKSRDCCSSPYGDKTVGLGEHKSQLAQFVLIPLYGDGYMEVQHGNQIFARASSVDASEWKSKGEKASFESLGKLAAAMKKQDPKAYGISDETVWFEVLVVAGGHADTLCVSVDPSNTKAATCGGRPLIVTPRFKSVKTNEHRVYIPEDARLFAGSRNVDFSLGTPGDLSRRVKEETGAEDLQINLRGQLVQVSGAVNHAALTENDAVRVLASEAGIDAAQAYNMVRKAVGMKDRPYCCLVKGASPDVGPMDTTGITQSQRVQTAQTLDPASLDQQAGKVAGTAKRTDDQLFNKDMLEQLLQLTDFREISADTLQALSAAMNEAGKLLLRVIVHREEYEDRYGEEDTERLDTACRKQFTGNGDMVLFLREKRGASGQSDNESLMDLLSEDMG